MVLGFNVCHLNLESKINPAGLLSSKRFFFKDVSLSCRNTLRVTRSAALSSQDGSVGGSMYLGKKGKDFEFSQLPMKVEFVECSARGSKGEDGGDADMELLEKALAKL